MMIITGLGRAEHVTEGDDFLVGVGNLDADRRLAGDRRQDPDVGAGHRVRDVLAQRGDLLDLDRRAELDLVAGDRRPAAVAGDLGVDLELVEAPRSAGATTASLASVRALCTLPCFSAAASGSRYCTSPDSWSCSTRCGIGVCGGGSSSSASPWTTTPGGRPAVVLRDDAGVVLGFDRDDSDRLGRAVVRIGSVRVAGSAGPSALRLRRLGRSPITGVS